MTFSEADDSIHYYTGRPVCRARPAEGAAVSIWA
jgi:hypothetical protein